MHTIIWEYKVHPGREEEFERVFGPQGDYSQLFHRSSGFCGLQLSREIGGAGHYIGIENWGSISAYESFHGKYAQEVRDLDERGNGLILERRKVVEHWGVREAKQRFWRRQFAGRATELQKTFDVVFGIALPIVCFVIDPIVFKGDPILGGPPMLASYRLLGYSLSALGMGCLALALWRAPRWAALSGALAVGSALAFVIGLRLLPLSGMALIFGIGAFGFVPFGTGFVFARNAYRSLPERHFSRVAGFALGAFAYLALPTAAHVYVQRLEQTVIHAILRGDPAQRTAAVQRLRRFAPVANTDALVWAWYNEIDIQRRQQLSIAYFEITGENLEERWQMMAD